eukprot:GFUD01034230.1.p1 GENE.GFUD01034230.1~~GFUD01034230.1.p1  ORF type:complete len:448 (-),score=113.19 GFUD01034230.1:83-1426(-)
MESSEPVCEIINRLFEYDLDEIIQKIFLSLDPLSLKNCKCVCSEWFEFIQKRLWNSKPAKKLLNKRLLNQWKFSEPFITDYDEGTTGVNFVVCDNEIIVCGYTRGQARVYDIHTGELKFQLQCNSQPMRIYDGVQLDLGRNVIGSVTDTGTVTVWDRRDGTMLYQDKHHGEHESVFGIKVTDEYILTGAGNGSLYMLESIGNEWKITHEMFENKEGVTHIDADGKWAVTGTRKSIKLWDLEEHKMVENVKLVKVKVWMLSFIYPHAFVVGGEDWNGIQIWDLAKCVQIRHISQDGKPFHNIHSNGRFLTVSEFNDTWAGDNNEMCSVEVYDVLELIDPKVAEKNLWKKSFDYSPGQYFEQINAVSNTTSLVVSHASKISILNFWKDRISPSREFLISIDIIDAGEDIDVGEVEIEDDIIDMGEDETDDEDLVWRTPEGSGQDEDEDT